jgi:hypothetical protein
MSEINGLDYIRERTLSDIEIGLVRALFLSKAMFSPAPVTGRMNLIVDDLNADP